jgi:autotransporter adhesin
LAMGNLAAASGFSSTAVGSTAKALAVNGTALGSNAVVQAGASNSVALGQGSIATEPQTVSVGVPGGERRITNVAAGVNPTDAVNVSQLNAVALGLQGLSAETAIGLQELRTETRRGIASALAANSVTTPIRPGGTTVGVSGGWFQGQSAAGVSVAHRLSTAPNLVVYGTYASGGGSTNSGKVGAAYEF